MAEADAQQTPLTPESMISQHPGPTLPLTIWHDPCPRVTGLEMRRGVGRCLRTSKGAGDLIQA